MGEKLNSRISGYISDSRTLEPTPNVSIPNNTVKIVGKVSFTAGVWLIYCVFDYATNANGRRLVSLSNSANPARAEGASCMANSGG